MVCVQNLAGHPRGAPPTGDRFPWLKLRLSERDLSTNLFTEFDDLRWNLVVIGQAAVASELRRYLVPLDAANPQELTRAYIPAPSFYLLRPDGQIGLAGTRLDTASIERYFADCRIIPYKAN